MLTSLEKGEDLMGQKQSTTVMILLANRLTQPTKLGNASTQQN